MTSKVKFFNYPIQFKAHEKDYMSIINDTLARGAYILGEDLDKFEKNMAGFLGCGFAIGVGNCTDALLLALCAAGVGPGDEVISVSHTFVASVEVVKMLGATPVLVDIADDHNMNVELVEGAISSKTKAIIPVDLNGRICSGIDKLLSIAKEHGLVVIEDSAQALGATYKGRKAGTFGLAGCFSFYPAKLLGAFGDGGMVVTNDAAFAEKLIKLRNHGRGKGTEVDCWGFNSRLDNLHAAILDFRLKLLPVLLERRRQIAAMYHKSLASINQLSLPHPPADDGLFYDVFQNYEIEAERRDELVTYLDSNGIDVMLPWGGKAVHQFEALGLDFHKLPRTEELFRKALLLPLYPEFKDKEVCVVVDAIKEFYSTG
jgi:dTDP-4-amino-4,6-dideoxygalactose transaminase